MSWLPQAEIQRRADTAQHFMAMGRPREAQAELAPLVDAAPKDPGLRQLIAQAHAQYGDYDGAERELRAALALAPTAATLHLQLGMVLDRAGRPAEAETALRAARSADRRFLPAAAALAGFLTEQGRAEEAVAILEPLRRLPDPAIANALAGALTVLGRRAEAAEQQQRAVEIDPSNPIAWHNLAATQVALERFAAADVSALRAQALGLDVPESFLLRGKALWGLDRPDEALHAVEGAIARRPLYIEAQREWAKMTWALTGEVAAATQKLDEALARPAVAQSAAEALISDRARMMQYGGDLAGADALVAAAAERPGAQPRFKGIAARMAVSFDADRAARYAQEAVAELPDDLDLQRTLVEARLAQGRGEAAAALAEALVLRDPADQHALALLHTAWRMTGDPRRGARDDHARLVMAQTIDTPKGWASLPAYLADLTAGLEALHVTHAHPVGQSLRGGTKTTQNLLESHDPAVKAFPQAVDGPIKRYLTALGKSAADPMAARNTGRYRFNGLWSVRLKAEGFHIDHLHPAGWISSACYIAVPPVVDAGGREGWIKFGEPGMPTNPAFGAEHFVKPEPGLLVLFPSYMWHGTVPFSGDAPRLTVAFDLVPGEFFSRVRFPEKRRTLRTSGHPALKTQRRRGCGAVSDEAGEGHARRLRPSWG